MGARRPGSALSVPRTSGALLTRVKDGQPLPAPPGKAFDQCGIETPWSLLLSPETSGHKGQKQRQANSARELELGVNHCRFSSRWNDVDDRSAEHVTPPRGESDKLHPPSYRYPQQMIQSN